ncbi:MAG: hypothetical protein H0Z35_13235 [Thermoanaerobacteraceae bacterium]|nr:hypothetical protein [Thermoanaerobacteraceae bacterium]
MADYTEQADGKGISKDELVERIGSINPNMKSSAHLAMDRFQMALTLNMTNSKEAEELRNKLTEEENFPQEES